MEDITESSPLLRASLRRQRWPGLNWSAAGIRTKILVPIIILMVLSILGSTLGFLVSTGATRESILTRQLDDEERRLVAALGQSEREALEAAELLTQDDLLIQALLDERKYIGTNASLAMVDRVVPVRDRFELDQVIVLDADKQARVNIGPSHLEPISINGRELLPACRNIERRLVTFGQARLLIICAPIVFDRESLAHVYTILDLAALLARTQKDLELTADVALSDQVVVVDERTSAGSTDATASVLSRQMRQTTALLGDGQVHMTLQINEQGADEIVASGLRVMLVSSGLTLVVLLLVGAWLAQSLTRPIRTLAAVAQAVAAGDLSQRANLTQRDEIGQLGRSFDHATKTITALLDQQARAAGERQAILQSIADGVLAVDMDERIVVINPAAAALLQQDAERLLGQPLDSLSVSDNPVLAVGLQQVVSQLRSELLDTDQQPTEEHVSLGSRIVRLQSAPILGSGRVQTGAVVIIQDVTRMVESDRAKSAFIATASHELRTPLTGLKGFVDMLVLSKTDSLTELQRTSIDAIKRQTDSVIMLVNDLLEMARLEQGGQRLECHWVSPVDSIAEALASLNSLVKKRNVTVEIGLEADLPSIWIDPLHLRRILINLISNAVKYVYVGGRVWIRAYELHTPADLPSLPHDSLPWHHAEERSLVITIEDNGVGIRASDHPRIFTRFFRSENPLSAEVGGTGLGLAITRSLVELHQGQIGFRSVEAQGSCFWIRLPTPNAAPLLEVQDIKFTTPDQLMFSIER